MTVKFDRHHWAILICSTLGGALVAYFEQQSPGNLIAALQSWATAKPLVMGAVFAAVAALVALAKQTFLVTPAPKSPDAVQRGTNVSVREPPASKRVALWWVGAALVLVAMCVSGCTPAEQALATNIENTVLADLGAGKSLPQIEADVASLIICPGAPNGSCKSAQAIVAIVNDTLDLLIGLGVIPPGVLPVAQSYHAQLTQQIAASRRP